MSCRSCRCAWERNGSGFTSRTAACISVHVSVRGSALACKGSAPKSGELLPGKELQQDNGGRVRRRGEIQIRVRLSV